MPVTRRLMKPGTWSLKLRPNTRHSVFSRINQFDQIVLLPTQLSPVSGFSDAGLLAAAFYTGVITKKPSATDLAGHGLEWYLGTPKGYGPGTAGTQGLLTTAVTQAAATLSTWVSALCPPALTVGTVTNGSLPTLSDSFAKVSRRESLDAVVRQIGAEYRVNPNGTIDAGSAATLFGSTATVVVTSKEEGRDGPYQGLEGSLIVTASDVDDYITRAIVVTQGDGAAATATTVSGTASFRDFAGNVMHVERYIDAPTALAANANLIGTAAVNKLNAVRRDLRLSSRTYNVSRFAEPGDFIFVYDPVQGLFDPANQIIYRGEVITPLLLRVFGLTFPIETGMGVYVRQPTGVGTANWIDITDEVLYESGEVQWEVGAPRRPLTGTSAAAQNEGTVAYLGVNPAIASRTALTSGVVGFAQVTANAGPFVAASDVGLSVTWVAHPSRRYRVTFDGEVNGTVAGDLLVAYITDGANNPVRRRTITVPALVGGVGYSDGSIGRTESGLSGTVTRKVRLERNAGTGTANLFAAAFSPAQLVVEDIGLA